MKFSFLFSAVAISLMSSSAFAQDEHAGDIEFGFNDLANPTSFVIESNEFTSENIRYFESDFEVLAGDFFSDEPGFITEVGAVNPGDQVWLRALDARDHSSFGVGYVNYWNPTTDTLDAAGMLGIYDNLGSTANLILNGTEVESGGANPQFIDFGDGDGEVHSHLTLDLLDDANAPLGGYGVMFQLQTDLDAADGNMDFSSDPFWIIWNHGIDEGDFDSRGLAAFGVAAIPEPASASILGLGLALVFTRRRRIVG